MSSPVDAFIPDPPGPDDDRFSRAFKPWREWHVAVDFLVNLHFGADDSEVYCLRADPPDVVFRDARFEVKEILDPGRRRHDEAKAALAAEALRPARPYYYTPQKLTPTVVAELMLNELERISGRYSPAQRTEIDLLFYVNKLKHLFTEGPVPGQDLFDRFGWRSVSAVLQNSESIVFAARSTAPAFLVANVGRVRKRHESLTDD